MECPDACRIISLPHCSIVVKQIRIRRFTTQNNFNRWVNSLIYRKCHTLKCYVILSRTWYWLQGIQTLFCLVSALAGLHLVAGADLSYASFIGQQVWMTMLLTWYWCPCSFVFIFSFYFKDLITDQTYSFYVDGHHRLVWYLYPPHSYLGTCGYWIAGSFGSSPKSGSYTGLCSDSLP